MEWRVGDGGRGPPGEHLHSHPRLAQSYRPTRRWRRFYRIRLSFDQRRAGAQPGVATVQIRPALFSRSWFTFRRIARNPCVCARFEIAHRPEENISYGAWIWASVYRIFEAVANILVVQYEFLALLLALIAISIRRATQREERRWNWSHGYVSNFAGSTRSPIFSLWAKGIRCRCLSKKTVSGQQQFRLTPRSSLGRPRLHLGLELSAGFLIALSDVAV